MEHPAPSQGPVFSEKETQSIDDASSGTLSVEPAGQNLRAGTLPRLDSLMDQLGLSSRFHGNASVRGSDPIIRSPHKLGEASATAQLLIGVAASAIENAKNGSTTDISIDIADALHYLHPTHFVRQAGRLINVGAEHVDLNNTYLCADGRYVMLEAGPPYPKLLKGYLNFFDCGDNKKSIAREVAKWNSEKLEKALNDAGLPCCRAFTREEWLSHPQGKLLNDTPVIEIEKIADGPRVPFPGREAAVPLSGVRVVDFTHVLAGPRSTRTLAEYGADVLHVTSPDYPDTFAQHLGVDIGKRCTYLDLRSDADLAQIHELIATGDVFATSYRHSVNERFGLLPEQLSAKSERGIVCLTANAYGHDGPWAGRPGFDQNGQVASGFAMKEGGTKPQFSPVFYLADLMTGYFAAAGMMAALLRRSIEGGSYHVKVSLARSAMWVQELGFLDVAGQHDVPEEDVLPAKTKTMDSIYGPLSFPAPPLKFTNLDIPQFDTIEPYGASSPEWQR